MPRRKTFKYAELPVFKYQTFDQSSLTFTDHPIVPPEKINFSDRSTDDLFKHDEAGPPDPEPEAPADAPPADPEPEPEIVEVTEEDAAEPGMETSSSGNYSNDPQQSLNLLPRRNQLLQKKQQLLKKSRRNQPSPSRQQKMLRRPMVRVVFVSQKT